MMKLKIFSTLAILLTTLLVNAQSNQLVINPNINLLKDSIESAQLIATLNDFLAAAEDPNEKNKWVLPTEKIETFILIDEIKGIQKSRKFDDVHFYKPYLTNIVPLEDQKYLVQISYIGVNENIPLLRASFELMANKTNSTFLYSSPLLKNTKDWKTSKVKNITFHYKETLNHQKTIEYEQYCSQFDKKLDLTYNTTEIYCCENINELLKVIGVDYKADYNGRKNSAFYSVRENKQLIVQGNNHPSFDDFDPHDLWHDRLSLRISRRAVNKPIDEGCAYLYGGSWGISWNEIFETFKDKVATNKNVDWKELKENPLNFGENQEEHLMADYVVNALIVQKLEKEKGFSTVWEFLNCGPREKGNDNYYKALEKLTGITKANYNDKVWELIKAEK